MGFYEKIFRFACASKLKKVGADKIAMPILNN